MATWSGGITRLESDVRNSGIAPVITGKRNVWLQLLMRPHGDAPFPLGRGIHPMTTVPLGLAVDAAIEAAGGYALDVTTLRYCSLTMEAPTSNRRALRATGTIVRLGRRHLEAAVEVWEVERLILRGRVGLVRVRGGRAVPLADRTSV